MRHGRVTIASFGREEVACSSKFLRIVTAIAENRTLRTNDITQRLKGATISVSVGYKQEQFSVHQGLLTASSGFFRSRVGVLGTKHITLPTFLGAPAFEVYAAWLYTGDMCVVPDHEGSSHRRPPSGESALICDCIYLAEYIEDDKFYNAAVDCCIAAQQLRGKTFTHLIEFMYAALYDSSPVLSLFVDFWVHLGHEGWFKPGHADNAPQAFWLAVAKGLTAKSRLRSNAYPWLQNRCKYHKHGKDDPKSA